MEKLKTSRSQHLRTLFLKYLAVFCTMTLLLLFLVAAGFVTLISLGWIQPASAVETQILSQKSEIATAPNVSPDMIPDGCLYGVYASDGTYLYGDMSESDAQTAWDAITSGSGNSGFSYMAIDRGDQICIVRYLVKPSYGANWANTALPSPDVLLVGSFLIVFLGCAAILAIHFGRALTKRMAGLTEAVENIQNQNLDFEIKPSGIREIDQTLASMDSMRQTLKESLEAQWTMEQERKQQIAALAHDIKAPLTVISGNADLMNETVISPSQKEYLEYILSGTTKLEEYVRQMIEVSQSQQVRPLDLKPCRLETLLTHWEEQLAAFGAARAITTSLDDGSLSKGQMNMRVLVDQTLIDRAFSNIAVNAVEYTPEHGRITIRAASHGSFVKVSVVDSGTGFNTEDIQHATNEFYRGNKARTPGSHYGMGLYIADTIVKQHGGSLTLDNTPEGGGMVTIALPFEHKDDIPNSGSQPPAA